MSIVNSSTYKPPFFLKNGHLQTILSKLKIIKDVIYKRERIYMPDGDFFDIDWSFTGRDAKKVAIIIHGLESSAQSNTVLSFVKGFNKRNWDTVSINFRGCSGVPNNFFPSYHAGSTEEIDLTVKHLLKKQYNEITLIGYSLGGNMCLRYLALNADRLDKRIKRSAQISVPCDLSECANKIGDSFYFKYFRDKFYKKYKEKTVKWPEKMSIEKLERIKKLSTFEELDNEYTGPINGFKNASDYWTKSSCLSLLSKICLPVLILNAKDDPFLAGDCYPIEQAKTNKFIYLEMPDFGGHCGFVDFNKEKEYWHVKRVASFIIEK